MKTALVTLTIIVALNFSLQAADQSEWTVRGSLGYGSVEATELVFEDGAKVSQLDWSSSILMANLSADWQSGKLKLSGQYRSSLFALDGDMVDVDWSDPDTLEWTDRSEGDAEVEISGFDISASYDVISTEPVIISLLAGYKSESWFWEDNGGSYVYSSDRGFRDEVGDLDDGTGITYEQELTIPYVGLNAVCPAGAIQIGGYVHYSPLAEIDAADRHLFTEASADDYVEGMTYFAFGVSATIPISDSTHISVSIDHMSIPEETGDSTLLETGEEFEDGAGTEAAMTSLSIVIGKKF